MMSEVVPGIQLPVIWVRGDPAAVGFVDWPGAGSICPRHLAQAPPQAVRSCHPERPR